MLVVLVGLGFVGCGEDDAGGAAAADGSGALEVDAGDVGADAGDVFVRPSFALEDVPFETLSEYGFFPGEPAQLVPAPGVVPYTPVSPLWADHAAKGRFVYLPEGEVIAYEDGEDWTFPLGAIVIKTFFLDLDRSDTQAGAYRVVETRLLVMEEEGWVPHTYVWNDEQTDAVRTIAGGRVTIEVVEADGTTAEQVYLVPNTNDCNSCHERDDETRVLGLVSNQLDYHIDVDGESVHHLAYLASEGLFGEQAVQTGSLTPLTDPTDADASLEARARSYLHANCGHCHRPGGGGGRSGLSLILQEEDPARYGVCKSPVAAGAGTGGRSYDIVPGEPDASIIPYRMAATDPEIRMPELPSRIVDDFGVTLVSDWISSINGSCE